MTTSCAAAGAGSFGFCFRLFFLPQRPKPAATAMQSLRARIYWTVSCGGISEKPLDHALLLTGCQRETRARRRFLKRFQPIFANEIPMMREAFILTWMATNATKMADRPIDRPIPRTGVDSMRLSRPELGVRLTATEFFRWSAGRDQPRNLPAPARPGPGRQVADAVRNARRRSTASFTAFDSCCAVPSTSARETERLESCAGWHRAPPENAITLVLDGSICGYFRRWSVAISSRQTEPRGLFLIAADRPAYARADCVVFEDAPPGVEGGAGRAGNALSSPPR